MRSLFLLGILIIISDNKGFAQEEKRQEEFKPQIRGAAMMANTHIPSATEGGVSVSIIPTWGMDIDYFFHPRWSVAMQMDIKLQSFYVDDKGASLERSYPIAITPVIHYHLIRHWSFYWGPGIEFERHENLFLTKIGTEYSFEITKDFEIALNLIYENRQEIYDGWTFGIAFNKKLWRKK